MGRKEQPVIGRGASAAIDFRFARHDSFGVDVPPVPPHGRWARDVRGSGRAVRVSAHAEAGFLIVSTWKADVCVATVRLVPNEAAELMAGLADGMAALANDAALRLSEDEQR